MAQKCKGFKEKAYGGCTSASACCNWGGIFVGVWMAPPHCSPWCGDPIDGNPGVLETRLSYLNGPHKGLKAYFTPFKNMNTCKGQPSAQLPAQPPGFYEDNVFFSHMKQSKFNRNRSKWPEQSSELERRKKKKSLTGLSPHFGL